MVHIAMLTTRDYCYVRNCKSRYKRIVGPTFCEHQERRVEILQGFEKVMDAYISKWDKFRLRRLNKRGDPDAVLAEIELATINAVLSTDNCIWGFISYCCSGECEPCQKLVSLTEQKWYSSVIEMVTR